MTTRMDTWIPDYASNQPLVSGTVWYGAIIPLYGATGFALQGQLLGGAAGTLTISPTNFEGVGPLYNAAGYPPARNGTNTSVTANNGFDLTYVLTNTQLQWKAVYVSFAPTASGSIYIAINVRRISA